MYVPFALPGEVVEIDRRGERGEVRRIVTASAERVVAPCPHYGVCGGCSLQHWRADAVLAWKREQVVAAFAQRGIAAEVAPVVAVPPGSRRRVVFTAERAGATTVLGFSRRGSHALVDVGTCVVAHPAIAGRLPLLRSIAAAGLVGSGRATVTVVAADNGLDVAIETGRPSGPKALAALAGFGADAAIARITLGGETALMARRPQIAADGATLLPVPGGFIQASAAAEKALADAVREGAGYAAPVADLFCGIGTFSLRLARHAPVTAVEGDEAALAALTEGARRSPGLRAVTTRRRDLFRNPVSAAELKAFGAVVFDPPRAGAKAQAEALAASAVPVVAAVSCNPATLARDARILVDGGYRMTRVVPVDQFLHSAHVEAVAVFRR